MQKQGLTGGTVGERMAALGKDPQQLFPNTAAGREQLLAYLERPHRRHSHPPAARLRDAGARAPDHQARAARDRGRSARRLCRRRARSTARCPANITSTCATPSEWPKFSLPTLCYHEGIPGHVWQGEYANRMPLIRSLLAFNAYREGWALYAEQLADELGVYDGDPLGQLGYLQSMGFRACRLVVDTGLHAMQLDARRRRSMVRQHQRHRPRSMIAREVDRYCAMPGQACGYKVGHLEIDRLRDKAKAGAGRRSSTCGASTTRWCSAAACR